VRLTGRLFRNSLQVQDRQPAAIVTGSWLTVKEQMAAVYAKRLAERGITAFTFDFSGFGESDGAPRQLEMPTRKIQDLRAAAAFLSTFSGADGRRLGHVAVCASAQYGLAAWADAAEVTHFVSVAGWYHDSATVAPFYGGIEGIVRRLGLAAKATDRFIRTGEVVTVPAYDPANPDAGMSFELDYYAQPARGAVAQWKNSMAAMSWSYWLTFDGLRAAGRVRTPALFIHGDGCVLPDNVKTVHDALAGPKRMIWMEGTQTDFYDQPLQVDMAVAEIEAFLKEPR
jgi:dienelactone hydrolase